MIPEHSATPARTEPEPGPGELLTASCRRFPPGLGGPPACLVPISLFCKEWFLKSRGLEVCSALMGAGLSRSGQKLQTQTRPAGHTHGPFQPFRWLVGPAAARCQAPGQLQASRPIPGSDLRLGRAGEPARKGISGELPGRPGWGSGMRGPQKACHRCTLPMGKQRLGKTTGMLGPLPPATLGDGLSLPKP